MTDVHQIYPVSDGTEASVIATLADEAKARDTITVADGRIIAILKAPGQVLEQIDTEKYEPTPTRKTGHVNVCDADSLIAYILRHVNETGTTVWGDVDAGRIVAVLDDHHAGNDTAGWAQHRAILGLKQTADWEHWLKYDGKLLRQEQFAEHLEDGVDAIREPDAATMLEVAQSFHVRRGVSFNSAKMLTGEIQFAFNENVAATAGKSGTVEIPQTFTLGLAPFEGCALYEIRARFRFTLNDGSLALGYRLIRPDKVRRAAFDEIVQKVVEGSSLPVMAGTPRS